MRRVIFNQKGGVGKSSITCNLAAISASQGYKTLVVDLDVQGNTTHYLGQSRREGDLTIGDMLNYVPSFFSKPPKASEYVCETEIENLDLLPSSPKLEQLEQDLERRYKIYKLREALEELEADYDRIYIDTPPNFNFYSKSALIAAQRVLIPFDCDIFSRQAFDVLLGNLMELKNDHNKELQIEGIVINQFNSQARLPRDMIQEMTEEGLPMLQSPLSSSVKMRESHAAQQPLIQFAPKHKLTAQFCELYDEIEEVKVAEPAVD